MGPSAVVHEPPSSSTDSGTPNVDTDNEVAEKEPTRDEGVLSGAWWFGHDIDVWGIKTEGGSWEAICDQVYPEKLDWDEGLGETESSREEDAGGERRRKRRQQHELLQSNGVWEPKLVLQTSNKNF